MTGDIYEPYIKATMEHASLKGYHCIMLNATAPSLSDEKGLAIINFKETHVIEQSVEYIRELLGPEDLDLYAIAYSAGSNHLVRHLGSHEGCKKLCGFKAAVSVSGVYDVLTAGIQLKKQAFGLYDWFLAAELARPYTHERFHFQSTNEKD